MFVEDPNLMRWAVISVVLATASLPLPGQEMVHTVRWDPDTLVLIKQDGGYGRIVRLDDGRLLCAFSLGRQVHCCGSSDEGRTWSPAIRLTDYQHGVATNADAITLADGTVLIGYNGRPDDGRAPFTIEVVRSSDGGKTWSTPEVLFAAGMSAEEGCWEPAFLQLPDGEVHVYFANEAPYSRSNEQEISLTCSGDGGRSWSAPRAVSFRAGHRDGMPVPMLLADRTTVLVAIEDNGLRGRMKPVFVSTSVAENWSAGPVSGGSAHRWDPLSGALPRRIYAGAPYICRTVAGHTVLSFQFRSEHRKPGDWSTTYAVVSVGQGDGKRFGSLSHPFAAFGNPRSIWNSVFAKGKRTVTLVSSAFIRGVSGLWAIDGVVVPVNGE